MSHATAPGRLLVAGRAWLARMPALIVLVYAVDPPPFSQRGLYGRIRHLLMAGFLVVFWAAPTMTAGHLLFAATATGYILAGIAFEERDLIQGLGDTYIAYRARVPALIPRLSLWRHSLGLSEVKKTTGSRRHDSRAVVTPAAVPARAAGRAAVSGR